jgi:hypothetical protein
MALRTPPSWLQNGSHPAENDRLTNQALLSSTGVIGPNSLFVSATGASMSVSVGTGWAAIVSSTSNAGVYTIYNDGATTLTVAVADPTNPRIDRVVATVNDSFYSGALNNVVFSVIAGTPAGSPVAPATPSNSISLATIAVGAGVTTIGQVNLTDTRIAMRENDTPHAYYALSATRSLTSGAGATGDQSVFGVGLTLQPNTTYEIEAVYSANMTTTSAAAVTVNSKLLVSGTFTSIDGQSFSETPQTSASLGYGNILSGGPTLSAGIVYQSAAVIGTYNIPIVLRAVIRTGTSAGVIINPQISLNQTTTSAFTISRNSFVKVSVMGPATAVSVGAWA